MRGEKAATGETGGAADDGDEVRAISDLVPVMIWRSGTDKFCDYVNAAWLDFTGRSFDEELGLGWVDGLHPDDYERCMTAYTAAFAAREPFELEYRLRRHDGSYRWVLECGRPFERDGAFAGFVGSCVDIDERKRREARQRLKLDELNHRVKNMLAGVQALAHQSLRAEGDPQAAYAAFCGRLQAMAAAHDTLSSRSDPGAEIGQLVRRVARPHAEEGTHYTAAGEPVWVDPKRAVSLALSLNELFTNAVRQGALAGDEGQIALDWSLDGAERVRLVWRERGGPAPGAASPTGFGRRLIEALGREGGGSARLDVEPEGIVCTFDFPLDRASGEVA
jgi:PAS domain S-box-containing protein